MKNLVHDIWQDLRAKRLLPVAVVLLGALIAVPVVLLKDAPDDTAAMDTISPGRSSQQSPVVATDPTSIAGSSALGFFDRKNPFRSLADPLRTGSTSPGVGTSGAGAAPGATDPAGAGPGGDPASAGDPMGAGGGSGAGGSAGSDPGSGASSGGGSAEPPSGSGGSSSPTPSLADPQFFENVVEVDFGRVGNEKRYRDVRALDSLPSERNPVVVYLGQTRSDESAFLVNQAIGQDGEGNCVPNRDSCNIVYLRAEKTQDDHYFETGPPDNFRYHLRLIAVRRKLDDPDASARSRSTSAEARTRVEGATSTRKVRRTAFDFRIPLIAGQQR